MKIGHTKAVSSCGLEMSSGLGAGVVRSADADGLGEGCLEGMLEPPGATLSGAGVLDMVDRVEGSVRTLKNDRAPFLWRPHLPARLCA